MSPLPSSRPRPREGFALALSLLLLAALSVLGAGMVALGAREALIAAQAERIVQARLDAEGAARTVAAAWSTRAWLDAAERDPDADLHPAFHLDVRATPLRPGLFLLDARSLPADGPGPTAAARASLLVHTLDPEALLAAFPATLTVDGSAHLTGGIVSGVDACLSGPGIPTLRGERVLATPGATLIGDPLDPAAPPPMPVPDPLAEPLLATLADVRAGPGGTPRPRFRDGRCEPADDNWGGFSAASPCHDLLPLVHATGPLRLEAGEGRGILVVDGDLALAGDFRFAGLVLVRGELSMSEDSRLVGRVRADRLALHGGMVRHDACQAAAAASVPALDGAFRPPGRWWVPSF